MARPFLQTYSLVTRGNPGLTCDGDGLALGPVILAKAVHDVAGYRRYRSRPPEAMARVLRLAYGPVPDRVIGRWCHGLARVVELLEAGEGARACIHAVLLGFPEIAPEGMEKLARAAGLRKYGDAWEDEPRVSAGNPDGGEWTSDGSDVQVAAVGDLPCEGFAGGCQSGGSYGSSAMYRIFDRNLCLDCATKSLGLENLPGHEKVRELDRFIIRGND